MARNKFRTYLYSLFHREEFQYSQVYEGNAEYFSKDESKWWRYKYFFHPAERAEKGRHIEEYFDKQDFNFTIPDGFVETNSLTLAAGGDIIAGADIRADNALHMWDDVKDFYFKADVKYANLEGPIDPAKPAAQVTFENHFTMNTSPEGFDQYYLDGKAMNIVSTVNNHSMDMGEDSLLATLDYLDAKRLLHVGTSRSEEERDNIPIIEKNGIRIAFISYTFSLNKKSVPQGKEYLANYIRLNKPDSDLSLIEKHIKIAKTEKAADIVVACLHWSIEFELYPIQNIIDMGHKLMGFGIDIIVGNHPHHFQPMEKYQFFDPYTKEQKQGVIVYALGDLTTWGDVHNSHLGYMLKLQLCKGKLGEKQTTRVKDVKIRPIYLYSKVENGRCIDFRLLEFVKLMRELRAGKNKYNFTRKEILELERLEKLMYKAMHKEIMA